MSLLKKLAGETAIYGVSNILGRAMNFLIMAPFLTEMFKEEQGKYGIVSYFFAVAAFLYVMFTYRLETAFFRFGNKSEHRDLAFSTTSISLWTSTFILVSLFVVFAHPFATFLQYPEEAHFIRIFAFIVGLDALAALPFAKLRLDSRPIKFSIVKLLNLSTNIFFILFFFLFCPAYPDNALVKAIYNPEYKVFYVFLSNLFASGVTILLLLPVYFGVELKFDKALWKQMIRYAAPLILVGLAGIVNEVLDRILLKRLLPADIADAQIGIYSACYKLAIIMTLFTQAFNYAAEPFFFKNADRSDSKIMYAKVAQFFTLAGCVGFLGIMLYLDLLQYIIASTYREGLVVVPILLMANVCLGVYYNFAIWYKLTDNTMIGAYIGIGGAMITIVLNILLIPYLGYVGSAWTTLICYAFMCIASYWSGRYYYPIPYPIYTMLSYVVLALAIFGVSQFSLNIVDNNFKYLINALLIFSYLGIVYGIEKKFSFK